MDTHRADIQVNVKTVRCWRPLLETVSKKTAMAAFSFSIEWPMYWVKHRDAPTPQNKLRKDANQLSWWNSRFLSCTLKSFYSSKDLPGALFLRHLMLLIKVESFMNVTRTLGLCCLCTLWQLKSKQRNVAASYKSYKLYISYKLLICKRLFKLFELFQWNLLNVQKIIWKMMTLKSTLRVSNLKLFYIQ